MIEGTAPGQPLRRIETAFEQPEKEALLEHLRHRGAEGMVLKSMDAPFSPGRDGHRHQFKYKFCQTASLIAGPAHGGKRSVSVLLHRDGLLVPAGHVTIPPNHPVPQEGSVVEVRYLYAFRPSGSIYQPVYLGVRDDIAAADCTVDQLKYKTEAADAVPA
jgi:bifunctional non-homologous end joining protein LigD